LRELYLYILKGAYKMNLKFGFDREQKKEERKLLEKEKIENFNDEERAFYYEIEKLIYAEEEKDIKN
jgi:hypothetical protein